MIDEIIEAVGSALYEEFGCRIYKEKAEQGLKGPCFFVSCFSPADRPLLGSRRFRENPFCIQYFPKERSNEKAECCEAAERLFVCLEYITLPDGPMRGTGMHAEYADGILNFFVNYDTFLIRPHAPEESMEEISQSVKRKGQV